MAASQFGSFFGRPFFDGGFFDPMPSYLVDLHDGGPAERERYRKKQERLRSTIQKSYSAIVDGPLAAEVEQVAQPFRPTESPRIDWEAFIKDAEAIGRMQELRKRAKEIADDDEDFMALMRLT